MKLTTLEAIGQALGRADVSYLVAGGVAVNAHGHQRLTHDLDDARHLRWIADQLAEDEEGEPDATA